MSDAVGYQSSNCHAGEGRHPLDPQMHNYYVYIMASKKNGTLYIGMTNDLIRRVYQHKAGEIEGFTKKYGIDKLVYYEHTTDVRAAIQREKQLKEWQREWKINLIEKMNPKWDDLYGEFLS